MSENKKKTSIVKDAIALCLIGLVAAIALGFVNEITKGPIEDRLKEEKAKAYQAIYKEAVKVDDTNPQLVEKVDASDEFLSNNGFKGAVIEEACVAYDSNDTAIGYVMTVTSKEGYGGDITFTMGYTADGELTAIEYLAITETAGLGMKATEEAFKGQFSNKKVESFTVVKSGASSEDEIDSISGATITSDAIANAVNAGVAFAKDLLSSSIGGVLHE